MNNKTLGTAFERELAEYLSAHGFWAHVMASKASGQPADVIAVRRGRAHLIDAKECTNNTFPLTRVENPPPALVAWCKNNLIVDNPDYQKKERMGKWTGNTPPRLWLYKTDAGALILPFGTLREVMAVLKGVTAQSAQSKAPSAETNTPSRSAAAPVPQGSLREGAPAAAGEGALANARAVPSLRIIPAFPAPRPVDYACTVPLYDYQLPAVEAMAAAKYGILRSPAGSGKTQMGIALIARLGLKTLWLTHTHDLLKQSYERAALYVDKSLLGTITAGKVDVGAGITFATVQTLAKQDLTQYRDTWDVIIVDECHRVAGSPTAMTQFGRVLSNLAARRKYGLSATVHRADGLVRCTHAYLGEIVHTVHDFDRRFALEDQGIINPIHPFRWSMLDGDVQLRF